MSVILETDRLLLRPWRDEDQAELAKTEYERFVRDGAPITLPLRDEPFGQRRFGLFDPAGVWIDVVEHIDSAPGWWDKYLV